MFEILFITITTISITLLGKADAGDNYIFQKGQLTPTDIGRSVLRRYPFNNATAESLNQYKKDVSNGNDYNLVGDNVGDQPSNFFARNHSVLSEARSDGVGAYVEGHVLFCGGAVDRSIPSTLKQSDVCDIWHENGRIWKKSRLSQARQALASVAYGGKAYFVGGYFNDDNRIIRQSNVIDIYEASTESWLTPMQLSEARSFVVAVELNGILYFAGGTAGEESQTYYSDRIDVYNADTDTWLPFLVLPRSRGNFAGTATANTLGFAGGFSRGHYSVVDWPRALKRTDFYDLTTGLWYDMDLSIARGHLAATSIEGFMVFAGGVGDTGRTGRIDVFEVAEKQWSRYEMSVPRSNPAVMQSAGIVIIACGLTDGGTTDGGTMWHKEGQSMRAQRIEVWNGKDWQVHDAAATSVEAPLTAAGNGRFYIAGGINNRRRTTRRVEWLQIQHNDVGSSTQHYRNEYPQWIPIDKNETCRNIWAHGMGAPFHGHGC